ncbi:MULTISPECIES: Gfo/Idh/MocA family protein [Nonomuraea]|uniref:Gfo/Idh/MocA family oxidoreductase n=1 Tax=Nonomuraea ferruginea TaxID=46174 RepID=A0ABT4SQW9_9ACTN|nr:MULTISPECIES: Gfo/Idh/MocA family oxidoreductase [Nonomuraea]MDA0639469.1 Gfo/Idh/MocA family oxidoreductase [Nonomuraea ferruginea]TXK42946.1 Gfo/Idh/MocA family oxidoreductase [Nonomuraea sp. C10]
MKIALVGCGAVTQAVYAPLLSRRRDLFEVTAVCDLSRTLADAAGDRLGAPGRYTSLDAMLEAGGFEAVLVLASGSHGDTVRRALAAGHAVLCEKPLALTRAEVAELPEGRLMVGYMKQYDPAVRRAGKLLAELGGPDAIRSVEVTVLHPSGESQLAFANLTQARDVPADLLATLRAREEALVSRALGEEAPAPVRDLYAIALGSVCHDLSLLRGFTGSPAEIGHVETWGDAPGSVEISGRLPAAGRFSIRWHYLEDYPAYRETVVIHHDAGSLELVFPSPYLMNAPTVLTVVSGGESRAEWREVTEAFEVQLAAFHAFVTDGTPPLTDRAGALEDIVTAQRIAARYAVQHDLPIGGEAA